MQVQNKGRKRHCRALSFLYQFIHVRRSPKRYASCSHQFSRQSHLAEGESIPVVPGVMSLTYILNPGAAFGMLEHQRLFFILMTVAVIAVLIHFWRRIKEEAIVVQLGAAFFLGGAVGNLIDRIETGFVIDFFDFYFWPIFNVADIFICVGVGLIVWNIVMDECRKTEPQK